MTWAQNAVSALMVVLTRLANHPSGNSGGPVFQVGLKGLGTAIGVHCYGSEDKDSGFNRAVIFGREGNDVAAFLDALESYANFVVVDSSMSQRCTRSATGRATNITKQLRSKRASLWCW